MRNNQFYRAFFISFSINFIISFTGSNNGKRMIHHSQKCFRSHLFAASQIVRIIIFHIFCRIYLFLQNVMKIGFLLQNEILSGFYLRRVRHSQHKIKNKKVDLLPIPKIHFQLKFSRHYMFCWPIRYCNLHISFLLSFFLLPERII